MEGKGPWLISIVGPTAAGKTSLSLELAEYYQTCILSADARQFYREMAIGTDKPSKAQQKQVPHYFVDSHSIETEISASEYAEEALALLANLFQKHDVVIAVGGSGLYLKALLEGFDPMPPITASIREQWNTYYQEYGRKALQAALKAHDERAYSRIDIDNPKRVIRALEVKAETGHSIVEYWEKGNREKGPQRFFTPLKLGVYLPRDALYAKIERRCEEMLANGLLAEVKSLYPYRHLNALNSVGYKEFFGYLEGQYDYTEAVRRFKAHSRQLAKRQLTWFRRDPEIHWFLPSELEAIKAFLNTHIKPPS